MGGREMSLASHFILHCCANDMTQYQYRDIVHHRIRGHIWQYVFVICQQIRWKEPCFIRLLHFCQKAIKNTSLCHTVALGDMLLNYHEHGHCSPFWLSPAVINTHYSATCNNPQHKRAPTECYLHTFELHLLKMTEPSCFSKLFYLFIRVTVFKKKDIYVFKQEPVGLKLSATDRVGKS